MFLVRLIKWYWIFWKILLAHCTIYYKKILNAHWLWSHSWDLTSFSLDVEVRNLGDPACILVDPSLPEPTCQFCQIWSQKTVRFANEVRLRICNSPKFRNWKGSHMHTRQLGISHFWHACPCRVKERRMRTRTAVLKMYEEALFSKSCKLHNFQRFLE